MKPPNAQRRPVADQAANVVQRLGGRNDRPTVSRAPALFGKARRESGVDTVAVLRRALGFSDSDLRRLLEIFGDEAVS